MCCDVAYNSLSENCKNLSWPELLWTGLTTLGTEEALKCETKNFILNWSNPHCGMIQVLHQGTLCRICSILNPDLHAAVTPGFDYGSVRNWMKNKRVKWLDSLTLLGHFSNEICRLVYRVHPKNYAQVSLCYVLLLTSVTHILQGCFTGAGAIIWLPQCQWSNPEGYG